MPTSGDPYYQDEPAKWIRWTLEELLDIEVVIDDRLPHNGAADRSARVIWIRPGLTLVDYHRVLARGCLYINFGDRAVPEFRPPELVVPTLSRTAVVLPLQRRPGPTTPGLSVRESSW